MLAIAMMVDAISKPKSAYRHMIYEIGMYHCLRRETIQTAVNYFDRCSALIRPERFLMNYISLAWKFVDDDIDQSTMTFDVKEPDMDYTIMEVLDYKLRVDTLASAIQVLPGDISHEMYVTDIMMIYSDELTKWSFTEKVEWLLSNREDQRTEMGYLINARIKQEYDGSCDIYEPFRRDVREGVVRVG